MPRFKLILTLVTLALSFSNCDSPKMTSTSGFQRSPTLIAKEQFIEALIAKMTLEEKCGQLNFVVGSILTGPSLQNPSS